MLWLLMDLVTMTTMILSIYDPAILKDILVGSVGGMHLSPEILFLFAVLLLVPLVMAFLSLVLSNPLNRWTNLTLGAVFTIIQLVGITDVLATPSAYAALLFVPLVVSPALIVWYAWKSRQKN